MVRAAKEEGVNISKVLTTHKHHDHAGGNITIAKMIPGLEIVGGDKDHVQGCTSKVKDGDKISVGKIEITCLHTPGHTVGHICYYATEGEQKVVFTGDTLFVGGVGRFFEGTPEEMQHSLIEKLGKLPPETLVYCGHEVKLILLYYSTHQLVMISIIIITLQYVIVLINNILNMRHDMS